MTMQERQCGMHAAGRVKLGKDKTRELKQIFEK